MKLKKVKIAHTCTASRFSQLVFISNETRYIILFQMHAFPHSHLKSFEQPIVYLFFLQIPLFFFSFSFFFYFCTKNKQQSVTNNMQNYYMACVCSEYNMCSDWFISRALFSHNAQQPIIGLQKQSKKPYNKQLVNLEQLFFIGKSQILASMY